MKHTVASLHAQVEALTARVIALEAQRAQPAAPRATNAAPVAKPKHNVQLSRREDGTWQVWLDYKPYSAHEKAADARENARQLAMSFDESPAAAQ